MAGNGNGIADHDALIAELKQQHGDELLWAETKVGLVVCRKPKAGEHERYTDQIADKKGALAFKALATACVVHPTPQEARTIFDAYPALCRTLATQLDDLAGGSIEVRSGK